jgi:hypothetical protein
MGHCAGRPVAPVSLTPRRLFPCYLPPVGIPSPAWPSEAKLTVVANRPVSGGGGCPDCHPILTHRLAQGLNLLRIRPSEAETAPKERTVK